MKNHHGMATENKAQREKELTVMAVEFVGYQRFFAIYRHTCALKLRIYQDIVVSCVAEHGGRILKLVNEGVTAYYFDPDEAVKSAVRMKTVLQKHNTVVSDQDQIGFAIFLHCGPGIVEGDEISGGLVRTLTTIRNMSSRQDLIYASDSVVATAGGTKGVEYRMAGAVSDSMSTHVTVHEVCWRDDINLEARESIKEAQFQYRRALVEGIQEPCFYCGSRRHAPAGCPSKHLPEQTQAFNKLRYLSVKQLNNLFSDALSKGLDKVRHRWEENVDVTDAYFDAYHGFYDIKRIFQPRFGRVIMCYGGNDWSRATEMSAESDGGRIWVALDHLRTGDMSRAELLLKTLYEENPQAFRVNLAMGYFNIEQGRHMHALGYFESAYKFAVTKPQKILALLLTCRVHHLYSNNMEASREQIRLIRKIDNYCPEALYQDIILQMRGQGDSTAIRQLLGLIASYPEYYLIALIDPDLISFQTAINEELRSAHARAKEQADGSVEESGSLMKRLESWLGEDDHKVRDLRERFSRVKSGYDSDSYYGYLDTVNKSSSLITECNKAESQSRAVMKSLLKELHDRLYPLLTYFSENRAAGSASMLAGIQTDLADFEERLKSSLPYKDAIASHKEISERLLKAEGTVDGIEKRRAFMSRLSGFLRKAILFFFMITLAGVILLFASQHASLAGMGLLSIFLEHRGSVLFGSCVVSLIVAAAVECYSLSKKQAVACKPIPKTARSGRKKHR